MISGRALNGSSAVLNSICIFRFWKLIALASAIFLLSANLDNIPDRPEALNTSFKSFVSTQFAPLPAAGCVTAVFAASETFPASELGIQHAVEVFPGFSPGRIGRLLRQAADSSPPAV